VLALGLLLSVAIGGALGALGSGGSILALPILVYVLEIPPVSAIPMSMVLVGTASAATAVLKWRQGDVSARALALMSSTGLVGAYWGSGLTHLVEPPVLMLLFAMILFAVGLLMLLNPERRLQLRTCVFSRCLIAGGLVGILTGFLGVGGGFLLVPSLVLFAGLDLKQALGTSAGIISINSFSGILGQLRFGGIDWALTGMLLAATAIGVLLGVFGSRRLPERILQQGLAASMLVIGVWIGVTSIHSL